MSDYNPFSLAGRHALVTGAGRGIGQAIAIAMARAGAKVTLTSRSADQLAETKRQIEAVGGSCAVIPADLSQSDQIAGFVKTVEDEGGAIDVVAHSAAAQHREPAVTFPKEAWDHVLAVNLTAPFLLSREVGRKQLERGSKGSHVFVCSLASIMGLPDLIAYNAAKGGLMGVVRGLSREWSGSGIRINGVSPGYVETKMTEVLFQDSGRRERMLSRIPMGEFGTPEQLGTPAVFLASDAAEYITGQLLIVDGGWAGAAV